jgi:hypothetical protein
MIMNSSSDSATAPDRDAHRWPAGRADADELTDDEVARIRATQLPSAELIMRQHGGLYAS